MLPNTGQQWEAAAHTQRRDNGCRGLSSFSRTVGSFTVATQSWEKQLREDLVYLVPRGQSTMVGKGVAERYSLLPDGQEAGREHSAVALLLIPQGLQNKGWRCQHCMWVPFSPSLLLF